VINFKDDVVNLKYDYRGHIRAPAAGALIWAKALRAYQWGKLARFTRDRGAGCGGCGGVGPGELAGAPGGGLDEASCNTM
jgi:hypothetical protein